MAAQGLWNIGGFNLPDFGISEALGVGPKNSAITNPQPNALEVGPKQQVAGLSNQIYTPYTVQDYTRQTNPQQMFNSSATTGGTTGGSTSGSTQQAPQVDLFQRAIEDAYGATMGFLNQAEGNLRDQQGGILSGIEGQYNTSKQNLTGEKNIASGEIDTAQQGGEKRQEDALTAARRLYQDVTTGGLQRFGAASSAGEAFQSLAGRELMRNRQEIVSNFQSFMGQVEQARTALTTRFQSAMANLEQKKNDALGQAQRDFQDRLLQISQQKSAAASQKAQQQLAALQDLRNQVFQINLANVSGTNAVNRLREQAEGELASAAQAFSQNQQQAMGAGQDYMNQTTVDPVTGLTVQNNAPTQGTEFTGQINPNEEEDQMLTGRIANPIRDRFAFA